eukprot:sb/3460952/
MMPSASSLVCGTEEGLVTVYDTEIMRPRYSWNAHKGIVQRVVRVGEDYLLTQGREGALTLWREGKAVRTRPISSTGFCRVTLTPDTKHAFLALDSDGEIACIRTDTLEIIRTFKPSFAGKKGMCWNLSVDDQYLYLGYESGDLVVFDHRDHIRQVAECKIHEEIISAIATHNRTIYTSSPDGTLARSQMLEGGELAAGQTTTSLECKSVGVLRRRASFKFVTPVIVTMATLFRRKKPPRTEEDQLFAEYRELEKRTVALSEGIKRWRASHINLCKGQKRMSTCLKQVNKIGLVQRVVRVGEDYLLTQGREGALTLWREGKAVRTRPISSTGFCRVTLTPDTKHAFLALDSDGEIACIRTDTLEIIRTFKPSFAGKKGMCWNLTVDDQYLYLGYESGDLVVFDHRDHIRQVAECKIHEEIISAIATHHSTIYTSSPDGTLARSQMLEGGELAAGQTTTSLECKSVGVLRVRDDGRVYVAVTMATLFRRKKPPRTEEDQLFAEYRELEKRTVALSEGIKRWRASHINLCKGQKRMSTCLKQVNKIGLDASSIARCVDLIITQRYKMLDEVHQTTQASVMRLHSLFSNMNTATKKRSQAKNEVESLRKKKDKLYKQHPIPAEKYQNTVKLLNSAEEKHTQSHNNLINVSVCILACNTSVQQFAPFARANQGVVMVGGQGCEYCTCMLLDVMLRLDEVHQTTQASVMRLHSLFSNMNTATKKRSQAKNEVESLRKKKDKLYKQHPIPAEKYQNTVKLLNSAEEKHTQSHTNLINDLRTISRGKYEYFEPCLESLLLAQLTYYRRVWKTLEPAIQEAADTESTLSCVDNMERLRSLSIVTGPQNNLKAKMLSRKSSDLRTISRGKYEYFEPCLESLLLAQLTYYRRVWKTLEPAIQEAADTESTLSCVDNMERLRSLSIVTGPQNNLKAKMLSRKCVLHFMLRRALASTTSKMSVESAKDAAAKRAIQENVTDGCRLGVGSGSTVVYAVKHLETLVKTAGFKVTCVPTSFQTIVYRLSTLGAEETVPIFLQQRLKNIGNPVQQQQEWGRGNSLVGTENNHIPISGIIFRSKIACVFHFMLRRALASTTSKMSVESAKDAAAKRAIQENVTDGCRLGVGSGSTVVYAVKHLETLVKTAGLKVTCVPTSFQARNLIIEAGLELSDLGRTPILDLVVDGADECDASLTLIKGGGGCQLQEKVVASAARRMVVIADYRKKSQHLGQQWSKGIPIEVLPMAYVPVMGKLTLKPDLGHDSNRRLFRPPVVTDNGNFVVDAKFNSPHNWDLLETKLCRTPGIVETGLFVDMAGMAYFGMQDGSVEVVHKPAKTGCVFIMKSFNMFVQHLKCFWKSPNIIAYDNNISSTALSLSRSMKFKAKMFDCNSVSRLHHVVAAVSKYCKNCALKLTSEKLEFILLLFQHSRP